MKQRSGRPAFKSTKTQREATYELAKRGCTEEEIANAIKVPYRTFRTHKGQFETELKKGREEGEVINIRNVENSLLKKALGFKYKEITREPHWYKKDGYIAIDKDQKSRITKIVTKEVIPSDQAIFFYLVNRQPNRRHSINNQIINDMGENAEQYFKQIADAIKESDTNSD